MNQVESRPLRYFVAVAEELSFARAAERLGIAPPALSRAIAQLETQVGVRLLERSTRRVALTAAGRVLLEQVPAGLDAIDAAVRRTQRAAGPGHRLVVAMKADLDAGVLAPAIEAYDREQVAVPVEVLLCGWGQQPQMLREGRADVALFYARPEEEEEELDLDMELLVEEPHVAALSVGHPLASRAALRLAHIDADRHRVPATNVWLSESAESGEPEPPRVGDLSQLLKLVELGQLVVLLPASVAGRYPRRQLAYRPVRDAPPAMLMIGWSRGSRSVAVAAFVRAAADVAGTRAPASVSDLVS